MNYWQRAFCYISRKRLRSLLLFLIFMVVNLVAGDFPSAGNEIVINQLLADQNGLKVGDDIQGTYRITGIFLSGTERQQTERVATVNRIENQIYVLADENLSESHKGYSKVICYAAEPQKLDELVGVLDEIYSEKAYVQANDHTYQKIRISTRQTGRITMFVLVITLITGCSVTGLLLSMWMRGARRKLLYM